MPGSTKTSAEGATGSPIEVAAASYDPGYDVYLSYASDADLKQGFCSYGVGIGEASSISTDRGQMSKRRKV